MSRVGFSSDFHFGHLNILKYAPWHRPFTDIEEMNQHVVDKVNDALKEGDLLYFLGDGAMNWNRVLEWFPKIKASIIFIPGNHDKVHSMHKGWQKTREAFLRLCPNIVEITDEKIISVGCHRVLLTHFPWSDLSDRHDQKYMELRPKRQDYPGVSYSLFGHIHSAPGTQYRDRGLDIGFDPWGRVVMLEEIEEIINA